MAEHFQGKFRSLHTTSGGGELLLRALIAVGEQIAVVDQQSAQCLNFLRERIAKGNGWYHIPAHPLPDSLNDQQSLLFFANTIEHLAQALVDDELPASLDKEFEHHDLRLRWAAFALELYELIRESVTFELKSISLQFREPADLAAVNRHRLQLRLTDAQKSEDLVEQLRLLSEIISLEKNAEEPKIQWSIFWQRAEVELKLGHTERAIESLNEGANYASGEDRSILLEIVESLRTRGDS